MFWKEGKEREKRKREREVFVFALLAGLASWWWVVLSNLVSVSVGWLGGRGDATKGGGGRH